MTESRSETLTDKVCRTGGRYCGECDFWSGEKGNKVVCPICNRPFNETGGA